IEQVVESRGTKGVGAEIVPGSSIEFFAADVVYELFEYRCPFGISDAIEVLACGVDVWDFRFDRVRGGQLILAVRPVVAAAREIRPGLDVLGCVRGSISSHVFGK